MLPSYSTVPASSSNVPTLVTVPATCNLAVPSIVIEPEVASNAPFASSMPLPSILSIPLTSEAPVTVMVLASASKALVEETVRLLSIVKSFATDLT